MIDCDIHNTIASLNVLDPYLSAYWRDYIHNTAFMGPDANDYPTGAPMTAHPDARPAAGGPPGSALNLLQRQALDERNVDLGILTCIYWVQSIHNPNLAVAMATALNQWQIEHWLEKEQRLRASLVVPSQDPVRAAQEIEQFGEHPGFVQVILPVRADALYGNARYDPIYEAAVRHDLAIGIHYGGAPGHPPSGVGWPSTFIEEYASMAQLFQSQLINIIIEGVFGRFPTLRVALIEGGFTWVPSLMWRLDKEWQGLRQHIPWVQRAPSDYMRDHIRLTTQPVDAPLDARHLQQIIGQLDSDEMLMFASDYPHWHFDDPMDVIVAGLDESLKQKILAENARAFYRL